MTDSKDPYNSEAETQALLVPDTRMKAERKLAKMMAERGADEQGAEVYPILRQIAVELLAEQPAIKQDLTTEQPAQQEQPVGLEAVYETVIRWDMGGGKRSRRELARRIVALYTSPPAQQPSAKCWKCGDSDPAYTDVCQVPACGMREA